MQHILNTCHTTSTFPRGGFPILRRNIWPQQIIPVSIVVLVEIIVAILIPISRLFTLSIVVIIVDTYVSLTLVPTIYIGNIGIWSETTLMIIYYMSSMFSVILFYRPWSSTQIVYHIVLLWAPTHMLQYKPQLRPHLRHIFMKLINGWIIRSLNNYGVSPSVWLSSSPSFVFARYLLHFVSDLCPCAFLIRLSFYIINHNHTIVSCTL